MAIFTTGLGFPEGPVFMPDGQLLIVEMTPDTGCITRVSADGKSRSRVLKTGRPNGLARDRYGAIWVAETHQKAVLRITEDGASEVFATHYDGERFVFLNDLAFAPNGDLYVTDSGVESEELAPGGELNPSYRDLKYDGRVYRVDVATGDVELIDRGFQFTNGLAFGPDSALYVNQTLTGAVYRYAYADGRITGKREQFSNVIERFDRNELKGPDGMKFGADGQLYVAVFGQGDITIIDRRGAIAGRIRTEGLYPTNLTFGAPGSKRIFVTEMQTGTIQTFDVATDGLPLHG